MDLRVADDLWAASLSPEGIFERWRVEDGQRVDSGDVVAEIMIEGARHEITSPSAGRLAQSVRAGDIIEPGSLLAVLQDLDHPPPATPS